VEVDLELHLQLQCQLLSLLLSLRLAILDSKSLNPPNLLLLLLILSILLLLLLLLQSPLPRQRPGMTLEALEQQLIRQHPPRQQCLIRTTLSEGYSFYVFLSVLHHHTQDYHYNYKSKVGKLMAAL
jgi:hypothetical protein